MAKGQSKPIYEQKEMWFDAQPSVETNVTLLVGERSVCFGSGTWEGGNSLFMFSYGLFSYKKRAKKIKEKNILIFCFLHITLLN